MKSTGRIIVSLLICFVLTASAYAQSSPVELQQMVEQLRKTPTDNALREKIIKLATEIKTALAVPLEAERYEGRAQYAFKNAKTETEMLDSAREYLKAVDAAPWVAGYYYDLCTILEKANRPAEAIRACKFYLAATSDGQDASAVRKRVAGLDFALERKRDAFARRQDCNDYKALYEAGNRVAVINGLKISVKLISSLYGGVWRNQLMLNWTRPSGNIMTQRYNLDPVDKTLQLEDSVPGAPYYRLTIASNGRITFGSSGSPQAEVVTSIAELHQLRNAQLNGCYITTKGGKFFVELAQGGPRKTNDGGLVAGNMYFEADCSGNLLGEKPGWFPAVFISYSDKAVVFDLASADACLKSSSNQLGWLSP
jgi:hypothetical protein